MTQISKEYAEALFAIAAEAGREDDIYASLADIARAFDDNPEYADFLKCAAVPMSQRVAALHAALGGRTEEYAEFFLCLLCAKGHIDIFAECVEEYKVLLRARHNISAAKVTSAVELTEEEKVRLVAGLEKKCGCRIEAEYSVDPSLIGGLTVCIDGKIMDGSVRRRLHEIKEVISQ